MTTMADFNFTDLIDDHEAAHINVLMAAALRAEYSNTETITTTKELSDNDTPLQIITASGADRTVELAPEGSSNHITVIYNAGASNSILVKDDSGATTLAVVTPGVLAVFVPILGVAWKVMKSPAAGYTLIAGSRGTAPADATTYYFGAITAEVLGTTSSRRMIYFPRAGVLRACNLFITGTAGTAETSSIYIRLNDTTDHLITNTVNLSTLPWVFNTSSLNISVTESDFFEIKWVTPTWATNPLGVSTEARVFVE